MSGPILDPPIGLERRFPDLRTQAQYRYLTITKERRSDYADQQLAFIGGYLTREHEVDKTLRLICEKNGMERRLLELFETRRDAEQIIKELIGHIETYAKAVDQIYNANSVARAACVAALGTTHPVTPERLAELKARPG